MDSFIVCKDSRGIVKDEIIGFCEDEHKAHILCYNLNEQARKEGSYFTFKVE